MRHRLLLALVFTVCVIDLATVCQGQGELEGFEDTGPSPTINTHVEAEANTAPSADSSPYQQEKKATPKPVQYDATGTNSVKRGAFGRPPRTPRDNYYFEYAAMAFFAVYLIAGFFGSRVNNQLAQAWADQYAASGTLLDKNFSLIGQKTELLEEDATVLMKESPNQFKLYASGRRYCQGLLATVNLRARQDLLSRFWYLFSPTEDLLDIETYMNEPNMPTIVLSVGTPKVTRQLQSNRSDIKAYTRKINISSDLLPGWPNQKLHVQAEHSSVFYDIFTDAKVQQVFTSPQYADGLKYFRAIHFTSENSEGSHKRVLKFQFALPPAGSMQVISSLMSLVPLFIDLVGTYKLPPEIRKKAADARAKHEAAAQEDTRKARIDAAQQRKIDKLVQEKERVARLTPEARRKYEEKLAKTQAKKGLKQRIMKA